MSARATSRNTLPAALLALLLLAAMPAASVRADNALPPPAISLTGSGEVMAKPDMAVVTSGVVTEARTAREALDANNEAMAEVIAAMKKGGIADKDLQTSRFDIQPQYYHPPQPKDGRREPPRIVGYRVSNQLSVTVRDLASLGSILDLSVTLGANQISGIYFSVDDDAELKNEARRMAVADALAKAKLYTEAAGVKLKRILSITESGATPPPRPVFARALKAEDAAVPIEAGEIGIRADVSISWELDQ